MKSMPKKRGLNEAFKRFQRLPDWPIAEINYDAQKDAVQEVAVADNQLQRLLDQTEETDFTTLLLV